MYPIKVITVQKSRELENKANENGMSYAEMMERAGHSVAEVIRHRVGAKDTRVVVLVGPGNNGGDGLVAAYYLHEMGARVTCYVWKRKIEGDSNWERIAARNLPVVWADDDADLRALQALLSSADVVVDGLLGVGVSRPIEGTLQQLLNTVRHFLAERKATPGLTHTVPDMEERKAPLVVAVDCPTGLDCDTGALDPAALPADITVTFAYPKIGLLRFPGAEAVGEIIVADIGIPPEFADDIPLEMATGEQIARWLPQRPRSAHKGTFGRALIVAGSVNYVGAAALAGAAAVRVGTGLVTMALPTPIQAAVAAHLAEATYLLLPHDLGVINPEAADILWKQMNEYEALLLGPGLTQEKEAAAFVRAFLDLKGPERKGRIGFVSGVEEGTGLKHPIFPPLVIDADGLNILATIPRWWQALPPDTILTPHPGEMARLVGGEATARQIQSDREGLAARMAAEWGVVLVLKGAFTVIAAPDGRLMVLPFANAGLATAGSGDVLAGAIIGLRAQGMGAFEAAVAGAYLHGLAGELTRLELGDMGMAAGDLLLRLPVALRRIRAVG